MNTTKRDGYEIFEDAAYFEMICVRPEGSKTFDETVHVATFARAHALVDWLVGKSDVLPDGTPDHEHALDLLARWKAKSA